MKKAITRLAGCLVFCTVLLAAIDGAAKPPNWVRVVEHAAWAPRDSCAETVFNGRMWLMGGWFTSDAPGPRDVWSSPDGANWTRATAEAPWKHGDLSTALVYDGRMWIMGGWYGGRKSFASASRAVWASGDGTHWTCETEAAPWKARLGAGGVVFHGKMWILGGLERYFYGTPSDLLNDVWCSADGRNWRQVTAHAAWAPRAYHGAVVFDNKIWIMGGGNYLPEYAGYNDVWNSPDGVHWTRVADHAPWASRIWFSNVVYRNRIWVLGGWSDKPWTNWHDVWFSADGKTWKELKTDMVWSKRHEQSFYVFADKIWVAGGNEWPIVNDVWQIDVPESWLREQP